MRIPESFASLVEHGVVDEVVRSLKSGKEADVFLVASEGFYRVAKVYKDAQSRSFKNRSAYTEGRSVRSSRDQRAMDKGSRYGRAQNEAAWQSAEVDMIYRLDSAGVRVPKPHHFIDGVLIMELVTSPEGEPAPRLGEVELAPEEAKLFFDKLLCDIVKMLCAGVVHGDLSEFNVLVGVEGPVVIDFPQAVNAARNQNARKMLLRDVENMQRFLQRHVPDTPMRRFAEEMWQLYEKGELTPDTQLTGVFVDDAKRANTAAVLGLIDDARRDERFKRQGTGRNMRGLGSPVPREPDAAAPAAGNQSQARPPHAQRPPSGNHPPRPPSQNRGQPQQARPPQPPGRPQQNGQQPHAGGGHRPQQQGPRPQQQQGPRPQQQGPRPQQQNAPRPPQQHRPPNPSQAQPQNGSPQRSNRSGRPPQKGEPRPQNGSPGPQNAWQQRPQNGAQPRPQNGSQQRPQNGSQPRPAQQQHSGFRGHRPPAPIVETRPQLGNAPRASAPHEPQAQQPINPQTRK